VHELWAKTVRTLYVCGLAKAAMRTSSYPRIGELIEGIIEIPELVEIEHLGFVIAHAADDRRGIRRWPSLASCNARSETVILAQRRRHPSPPPKISPSLTPSRHPNRAESAHN
jgi:hypothetical protein